MSENNKYVLEHSGEELDQAIEHFLNPKGGLSEQIQSDYEQNDSTQVDYIKNRPFYHIDDVEQIYETSTKSPVYTEIYINDEFDFIMDKVFDFAPLTSQLIGKHLKLELTNLGLSFDYLISIDNLTVCKRQYDIFQFKLDLSSLGLGVLSMKILVSREPGYFKTLQPNGYFISSTVPEKGIYCAARELEAQGIQMRATLETNLTIKNNQKFQHFTLVDVEYYPDSKECVIDEYNLNLLRESYADSYVSLRINYLGKTDGEHIFITHYGLPIASIWDLTGDVLGNVIMFQAMLLGTISINLTNGTVELATSASTD